jgi:hypothetical protein
LDFFGLTIAQKAVFFGRSPLWGSGKANRTDRSAVRRLPLWGSGKANRHHHFYQQVWLHSEQKILLTLD